MIEEILFEFFVIIGTIAFGMSGAYKGIRHKLDILGVLVLGFSTAIGGGLIRDALLPRTPTAFLDLGPAIYALIGCGIAMASNMAYKDHKSPLTDPDGRLFLSLDAIGLAAFTIIGAQIGAEAGLNIFGIIILAVATGVGGGMIRDLLVCEIPLVLKADFYATATIIGAFIYAVMLWLNIPSTLISSTAFIVTLGLRLLAIEYKWQLPAF